MATDSFDQELYEKLVYAVLSSLQGGTAPEKAQGIINDVYSEMCDVAETFDSESDSEGGLPTVQTSLVPIKPPISPTGFHTLMEAKVFMTHYEWYMVNHS